MPKIKLDAVTIDCPDSKALVTFYHQLTGMRIVEVEDGFYPTLAGKTLDLVFQQIDNYQPPTWPTQERGQQIHVDCTCPDIEAGAKYAESIGATRAPEQPGGDWIVMLDPAGHPVCIAMPFTDPEEVEDEQQLQATDASSKPNIMVASISFDCPDNQALASFYAALNAMTPIDMGDSDHSALLSTQGYLMTFQRVENYQAPTWPTQERGQQMHLDFAVDDIENAVKFAESLGSTQASEQPGERWRVMLDPAGHPFCLFPGA